MFKNKTKYTETVCREVNYGKKVLARVIKVQNENNEVVINKGSIDGVNYSDRYLVFKLGEELFDPDTNESLGFLELICGNAKVKHIQERLTTLASTEASRKTSTTITKRSNLIFSSIGGETEETIQPEVIELPFENVDTTCFARKVN